MTRILTFIIILFQANVFFAQTNEGTEFWFAFMEHIDGNRAEHVVMITSRQNTSGTISVEGINYSQNFNVTANEVQIISLPSQVQNTGSESIQDLGIYISSDDPISVYIHHYHDFRSEAALILPLASLATEYYIMSFSGIDGSFGLGRSEFVVIATEDDTELSILLSDNTLRGAPSGSTLNVILNKGETYQVQGATVNSDLTGTRVRANKNYAVLAGSSWSQIPQGCRTYDNILEMMTPIDSWGKEFIGIPMLQKRDDDDIFRILSADRNNTINVKYENGTTDSRTIDRGEFWEFESDIAFSVSAELPVIMAQYMKGSACTSNSNGDPSMLIINSIEQIRDTITIYNSNLQNIYENFISIITKKEDASGIELDGNTINTWKDLDDFSYAVVPVQTGAHTITSAGCGVIASAFGIGDKESYAYGGGASFAKINASPLPEGSCFNLPVYFNSGLPSERYDITWDIGDDVDLINDHSFQHTYSALGTYEASAIIYDKCFDETDTLYGEIFITNRQSVDVSDDLAVCLGDTITLEAIDSGIDIPSGGRLTYLWTGPNNFEEEIEETEIVFPNSDINLSGQYEVIGIVSGCKTEPALVEVEVRDFPQPYLGRDSVVCSKEVDFNLTLDAGEYVSYLWQDNSTSRYLSLSDEGEYRVTVTDDIGCSGGDAVVFKDQCPTRIYLPNIFQPSSFDNKEFGVYGDDITSATLYIYDRWGNLVFKSSEDKPAWSGYSKGKLMEQGVYPYLIEYTGFGEDGNPISELLSGTVFLMK